MHYIVQLIKHFIRVFIKLINFCKNWLKKRYLTKENKIIKISQPWIIQFNHYWLYNYFYITILNKICHWVNIDIKLLRTRRSELKSILCKLHLDIIWIKDNIWKKRR